MEGKWQGHGIRSYPLSGRQTTIDAVVETSLVVIGGSRALLSQNQITETAPDTSPRTYSTVYWVRAAAGRPDSYELGAQGSTEPTSSGSLGSDGIFRVEQDLGGGSQPYVIQSETQFLQDHTVYTDTFSIGTEIQSKSRIEYQRITP